VAAVLKHVEIRRGDFELTLADITPDDFAYLDPPYFKLGGYSDFNRYTKTQFREHDHVRLAAVCRELHLRRIRWAVSNSDTELVRNLFKGFRKVEICNRREINLNSDDRDITELLMMNYDESGELIG
jgi:DNA adenine methylase